MIDRFTEEAARLANMPSLTKAEERRFAFLVREIAAIRAGKASAIEAPVTRSRDEQREQALAQLKDAGVKSGHREKVLKILRPELSI